MDQSGNLMEQVGDGFGGPLQEELISRLEQTIADFHEEVNEMLGRLKENSEKRHEKLKEIWNNLEAEIAEAANVSDADSRFDDAPGLNSDEMRNGKKRLRLVVLEVKKMAVRLKKIKKRIWERRKKRILWAEEKVGSKLR